MVIQGSLSATTSADTSGRIVVDESDYRLQEDKLPFEIKEVVRIRANEKFSKFYECFDEIGEGKFGKVYRCREKATGLELAAKRIKIRRDADRAQVEKEVAIMTQMRHPRIAQIYDAFSTPDNDIILVMEVVRGGELFDRVVDDNYILTEMAVVMIVCQLCEAVSYIHSKNIVHLDIKPENIMCVSQTGNRIKLIDFGLAQYYDGSSNLLFMAGTPEFVAPEVIKFEPIDFHTDMWSIGVITYILLSGISPFLGETLGETYCAVEKGEWEFDEEAFEGISDAAKDFISKLLVYDQKKRMLPEECLQHEWIVGSRARASNDLLLNQPNIGKPLSKEGLKSYLKNKRFRKATWALVFLIRFKKHGFMNWKMLGNMATPSKQQQCTASTSAITPILSGDDSQFLRSTASVLPIADGIGPSTSTATLTTLDAENTGAITKNTSARKNQRDSEKETSEKPSTVSFKKMKADESNCKTVEKTTKVDDEVKELPKNSSVLESKPKRISDGCRPDTDWQINASRNRPPINTTSEINRKANSVATILSMFKEKDEVPPIDPRLLERRSSRAGRTLRDVERPLKKMSSVIVDDLPPVAITELRQVAKAKSENSEKVVKRAKENIVENTEQERHSNKSSVAEEGRRRKVGVSCLPTTHEGKAPELKEEAAKHINEASCLTKTKDDLDEAWRRRHGTASVKKDAIEKTEKSVKEKKEAPKVNSDEKVAAHCTSMIIPVKFEKSSTMIVKTKMSVKNENKTSEKNVTKAVNGQLIEESHRSEKNATSIDVSKSKTTHSRNEQSTKPTVESDSRIAQFRSVALQAEMHKKITANHEKGQTKVELTKAENAHTGKVHLAHETKLNDASTSKESATAEAGHQNTAVAKKVTTSTQDSVEPHVDESLTLSHKESFLSSVFTDGKVSTEETSNKSTIKISSEKPPSGSGDRRRRSSKKPAESPTASDSDGSKVGVSEPHGKHFDSTKADAKRQADSFCSTLSSDTTARSDLRKNIRTAVSRTSSDASSEGSDISLSESKRRLTKKVKEDQRTKDATKLSDSSSNLSSENLKSDFLSPQINVEITAPPRTSTGRKSNVTGVDKSISDAKPTLMPFHKKDSIYAERIEKFTERDETAKSSDVNGTKNSTTVRIHKKSEDASTSQQGMGSEKLSKSANSLKAAIVDSAAADLVSQDIAVSTISSTVDIKRKSAKDTGNESSSEEETKKPKLSLFKNSSKQEYERHQKKLEPKLSWHSELLKSFNEAGKIPQKTGINYGKAQSSATANRDKNGYDSDGEYMQRSSLKAIASDENRKIEYRSLANISVEDKTAKCGKLSKRKVTFSSEVLDPKPTINKITNAPGFALSRVQSESNIAEKAKISMENSLKVRRMTMDDTRAEELRTISIRRQLLVQQGRFKKPEVSSLGWLKTRLESRISEENSGQSWKKKSEIKIPICAAGNAKRALDMWKNMEQNMKKN